MYAIRKLLVPLLVLFSSTLLTNCVPNPDMNRPDADRSDTDQSATDGGTEWANHPNVLLLIADDYGVDSAADYQTVEGHERVVSDTPNISRVCNTGVKFANTWSLTTCSPTRSSILTGRYGFRTRVGAPTPPGPPIRADEVTVPRLLEEHAPDYAHANIGKWHLGKTDELMGASAPTFMGWDYFAGHLTGHLDRYDNWRRTVQGETNRVQKYATSQNVDDAIDWIDRQAPERPWFVWLAFNAPHTPFHAPPEQLHSYDDLTGEREDIVDRTPTYYMAMVEAMDTEIGRLFDHLDGDGDGLPDDTHVIFVGDNGTPWNGTQPPYQKDHAKDTPYQGGVHVPLCITGPRVASGGRTVEALTSTVDLHTTLLELAGIDPDVLSDDRGVDSVSLMPYLTTPDVAPMREFVYTEGFGGTRPRRVSGRAIRDERYKLIQREDGPFEAYDLRTDPLETTDLTSDATTEETTQRIERLKQAMNALLCSEHQEFCE